MLEDCVPDVSSHVAVNVDHYILVFSGIQWNMHNHFIRMPLNVIWVYNLYTEQWRRRMIPQGSTLPAKTYGACAVAIRSDVYMFGGYVETEGACNALWKLVMQPQGSFVWSTIVMTNNEKAPSPRCYHTGWEYAEKLWTFGGSGKSPAGFLNDFGDFNLNNCNNQLLCFDPSNEDWTNPQCYGMVPEPRAWHATTASQEKVWLYGGIYRLQCFNSLHELSMHSCTWTLIQSQKIQPQECSACTLTISDDKLILHSGSNGGGKILSDTWIVDLETKMWKKYTAATDTRRSGHTGSRGINNSVIIIGKSCTIFHVLTEPKSLQQLAVQNIHTNHTLLPWKSLPRKLIVLLDVQETEDAGGVSDNN